MGLVGGLLIQAPVWAATNQRVGSGAEAPGAGITFTEDRAFLGVVLGGTSRGNGIRVTDVIDGSAAEAAGLQRGDRIVEIDGVPVTGSRALTREIRGMQPGDTTTVTVVRAGEEQTLTVELGRRAERGVHFDGAYTIVSPDVRGRVRGEIGVDEDEFDEFLENTFVCRGDDCRFTFDERRWYRLDCLDEGCPTYRINYYGRPMLGIELTQMTRELRRHLGGDGGTGVLVARVIEGSPADRGGIAVGDLVVSVADSSIEDAGDIRRALEDQSGHTLEVGVIRDGRPVTLQVRIAESHD
jgi:S1-C subfamily serine protease